ENRVAPVPEGEAEAEALVVVRDAQQPVLAPAIGPRARVLVGKVLPGRAVDRVVLADGSPLSRGQVGAPAAPVGRPRARLGEAPLFSRHTSTARASPRRPDGGAVAPGSWPCTHPRTRRPGSGPWSRRARVETPVDHSRNSWSRISRMKRSMETG